MVYIPPYIVSKLDTLSVYDVAERLGIEIVRNHTLCFMHDDHHPSMSFKKSDNSWRCYVCGVGGHSIELVKRYNGYTFQGACIWLARNFNIEIPDTKEVRLKKVPARKVSPKVEETPVGEEVQEEIPTEEVIEPVVEEDETDDTELVAVIAAAIAASENTSTDAFVVRSIRKRR